MQLIKRLFRFVFFLADAAFADPLRTASAYKVHPLRMSWGDFWKL